MQIAIEFGMELEPFAALRQPHLNLPHTGFPVTNPPHDPHIANNEV